MSIDNTLSRLSSVTVVAETILNNTKTTPWQFEDANAGGCVSNCGNLSNVIIDDNSVQQMSNSQPLNGQGVESLVEGFVVRTELPDPYSNQPATTSFSYLSIDPYGDDYLNRIFDSRPIEIKIGGVLDAGLSTENELSYINYPTWIKGITGKFEYDSQLARVSVLPSSDELQTVYPQNSYISGDSEGLVKPQIFGKVFNYSPRPEGGGIFQFHDGSCEMSADIIDQASFSCLIGDFYYQGIAISTSGVGGGTVVSELDYTWTIPDPEIAQAESSDNTVSVSEGFNLSTNGNLITISPDAEILQTKTFFQHQFLWEQEGTKILRVNTDPKLKITLSGDVDVTITNRHPSIAEQYRASWFKIDANGTGNLLFEFEDTLKDVDMVIRAVRSPFQDITNFSDTPSSIDPAIPSTSGVQNHRVKFRNLNKNNFSFDYTSTTDVLIVAIWFEKVVVYESAICSVQLNLSPRVNNLDLGLSFSNTTQSLEYGGTVLPSSTTENIFTGLQSQLNFNVNVGYGNFSFFIKGGDREGNARGVTVDNGVYTLNPASDGNILDQVGITLDAKPFIDPTGGIGNGVEQQFEFSFKARIKSGQIDSLLMGCDFAESSEGGLKLLTVDSFDFKEFRFTGTIESVIGLPTSPAFQLFTWRGDINFFGWPIGSAVNDNVEFQIEVTDVCIIPTFQKPATLPFNIERIGIGEDIRAYVIEQNARRRLKTFRVQDARKFKNRLPRDICLYDSRGRLAVSNEYDRVFGDFVGESINQNSIQAIRKISTNATGIDYITTSVTGSRVGFVIDQPLPFIQHISRLLSSMDLYYTENLATDGIEIFERYKYTDPADDFYLEQDIIILDSVRRLQTDVRENRYIIEYRRDYNDDSKTKRIYSRSGFSSELDPKVISTPFFNQSSAQVIADTIIRDSVYNSIYELRIVGIGHGIKVGQAGKINHPLVPRNKPCIIQAVGEDTNLLETQITLKVLQGDSIYV